MTKLSSCALASAAGWPAGAAALLPVTADGVAWAGAATVHATKKKLSTKSTARRSSHSVQLILVLAGVSLAIGRVFRGIFVPASLVLGTKQLNWLFRFH